MMRPGVGKNLLSRRDLAGKYLTEEHNKIDDEMKSSLSVSLLYYCQCIDKIRGKKLMTIFISSGKIRYIIARWMVKHTS